MADTSPANVIALENVLCALGLPIGGDENFDNTAHRWLKSVAHYMQPYDPKADLGVTFPVEGVQDDDGFDSSVFDSGMVVQSNIPYRALCAHHLLPVLGTAHVGYLPTKRVVGISKLARLVYGISHSMPSLQEDVGFKIAFALENYLETVGSICVISAEHGCMACRGTEEHGVKTNTASLRGAFKLPEVRQEFYSLLNINAR